MKCSKCGEQTSYGGVAIAIFHEAVFIVNLCGPHAVEVLGMRLYRRLKRMSGRQAWVQGKLPYP